MIYNNYYSVRLQYFILQLKIFMDTRKNVRENYRQFGQGSPAQM